MGPGALPVAWESHLRREIDRLASLHLLRETAPVDADAVVAHFGSNDYLGLAHGRRAKETGPLSAKRPLSSTHHGEYKGSMLVSGYSTFHEELERKLLKLKGLSGRRGASALLFPSGYAANLSVGMSLCALHPGQDTAQCIHIFSDQLNHASIIDGVAYAKAKGKGKDLVLHIYKHNDVEDLRRQLDETPKERALKIVITESVFSMDGDICSLREIVGLKKERNNDFLLVLDEAHATLVFGQNGGGLAQHLGLSSYIDITVGTLSKAIGSLGGFIVVHTPVLRSFILNKGRPLIYSTSLPISLVQCAISNIDLGMSSMGSRMREKLRRNVAFLKESLIAAGFSKEENDHRGMYLQSGRKEVLETQQTHQNLDLDLDFLGSSSPIIPLRMPSEHSATDASHYLKKNFRLHVPAIRPPTVPRGTSRLRIAVTAAHMEEELTLLVKALKEYKLKQLKQLQNVRPRL